MKTRKQCLVSGVIAALSIPLSVHAADPPRCNAADGRFIATLENGQKWLQLEKDSRAEVKVGETVTLKPMMFGGATT
jgi:hypothetical protein